MCAKGNLAILLVILMITSGCLGSAGNSNATPSPLAKTTQTSTELPTPTSKPTPTPSPTPSPTPTPLPPQNPWRSEVVTVSIADPGITSRNHSKYVMEAVEYWNENMEEYTPYAFELRYVPNEFNADIVINFEQIVECNGTYDNWGCAPVIDNDSIAEPRVQARIKTNTPGPLLADLITHEMGHILGLGHSQHPPVMAESLPEIDRPITDATQRTNPFLTDDLQIYVEWSEIPEDERSGTEEQFGHAMMFVQDAVNEKYDRSISITATQDRSEAEVIVSFPADSPCLRGAGSCGGGYGYDIDSDSNLEYYSDTSVAITDIEVEARGWHLGYWLATFIYQVDQPLPPVIDHADYYERRGEWWE